MPHHLSAKKRLRTNAKAAARNRHYRSMMRTAVKNVRSTTKQNEAQNAFQQATSLLDKLVSKGIIHKNTAANKKSRLAKYVNSLA
jgi:small subunit ribosomal protein S20